MALDVAVTGMGVVSPLGCTPASLMDRLIADDLGIRETPWTAGGPDRVEFSAAAEHVEPPDWMDGTLAGIAPFARHAGGAVTSALADAGLNQLDPLRTG